MTVEEIKLSNADVLTAADVAGVLGCKPYSIIVQAKTAPAALGFPVSVIGSRVKIPRIPFLKFLGVTV